MRFDLDQIFPADECRRVLSDLPGWPGVAVYVLWDGRLGVPVYCGTARNKSRLRGHLNKDDLARRPVGTTSRNPELRNYCLAQSAGWLGVSFTFFSSFEEAREAERGVIARYGIRKSGGLLFNQRMEG